MASERLSKLKCPFWVIIILVVCLVAAVIGLIVVPIARTLSKDPGRSYVIMVDAGSSSSKLYVYSWPSESSEQTAADVRQEFFRRTMSKGVSSYADEPENASKEIVEILRSEVLGDRDTPAIIPADQRATTPIYMGATAGMRLLEARDNVKASRLLARLRDDFSKLGLLVTNATKQMRVITGDQEALAGWISSNYLYDTLKKDAQNLSAPQEGTIGALDMGGASTQISFVTKAPVGIEVSEVPLYNRKFRVYQHSFLCFGKGEARSQIYASVWVANGRPMTTPASPLRNPCQHKGHSITLDASDFLQKPCFYAGPGKKVPMTTQKFTFEGTGDYESCQSLTQKLLAQKGCNYSRCSFDGIYQPPLPPGKFVAFSSYYFAMHFFNVTRDRPSRNDLRRRLKSFCSRQWDSVLKQYSKAIAPYFLRGYCFDGIYIDNVVKKLGFDDTRWPDITFTGKIGKRKMSWPLGFILMESASVPPGLTIYKMATPTYIVLILLFVLILIICILLLLGMFLSRWWGHRYTRANREQGHAIEA